MNWLGQFLSSVYVPHGDYWDCLLLAPPALLQGGGGAARRQQHQQPGERAGGAVQAVLGARPRGAGRAAARRQVCRGRGRPMGCMGCKQDALWSQERS